MLNLTEKSTRRVVYEVRVAAQLNNQALNTGNGSTPATTNVAKDQLSSGLPDEAYYDQVVTLS